MSENKTKKKLSFDKLNLEAITNPLSEVKVDGVVPDPVELTPLPSVSLVKEGTWIFGIPLEDVTSEQFSEWLSGILPGAFTDWTEADFNTARKKQKIIDRLSVNYNELFFFPKTSKKKLKTYVN